MHVEDDQDPPSLRVGVDEVKFVSFFGSSTVTNEGEFGILST